MSSIKITSRGIFEQRRLTLINWEDTLAERNERASARREAQNRDISNVQNWIKDRGSIARNETEYIEQAEDIMSLRRDTDDSALEKVTVMIERLFVRLPRLLRSVRINSCTLGDMV